jgi:2Fe-2S ferredoxin
MPQILIRNLNNKVVASKDNSKTALNIIHENQIDWMHACGAKGRCTTCKLIIDEGMEHLSSVNAHEQKFRDAGRLQFNERLACQVTISGDIAVRVAQQNKFPHIEYSD